MDDHDEITDIDLQPEKAKTYDKGSRMDNLVTIIENQTELLHWLSTFDLPDADGKGSLYDKWVEQKIKVSSNAMKLIMRCQAEFAKISRNDSSPTLVKKLKELLKDAP